MSNGQQKTSGMAIAALVLSLLMCIPLCPLIGFILGLLAVSKISKNPALKGKGLAIAAIVISVVGGLGTVGATIGIGVPAMQKYIWKSKAMEAEDKLAEAYRSALSYYIQEQVSPDGRLIPPEPIPSSPLTPAQGCCSGPNNQCQPNPAQWDTPTWHALNFAIADPHYFQYQFESQGNAFTIRAIGDLDCDGTATTFERSGVVGPHGVVEGSAGLVIINELE